MSNRGNSEYKNEVVLNMWNTENGHLYSAVIDAAAFDKLQTLGVGDKIFVRKRKEAAIRDAKNPETTPTFFLERVPREEVEAYRESSKSRARPASPKNTL